MRDPQLPSDDFLRDAVLYREDLFGPAEFAPLAGACRAGAAVVFTGLKQITLHLPCPHSDLSRFNQLTIRVCNHAYTPLLAGVRLIHGNRAATSFSGGREEFPPGQWCEMHFPRECFGITGHPDGWQDVRALEIFFAQEKTAARDQEISVALKGIAGELRRLPPGPRLTESGLREQLVGEAGDTEPLLKRLLSPAKSWGPYGPENIASRIPPPHFYPQGTAADILAGRIMGQQLPAPLSWDANPLGELEWCHFLHRHHFLRLLVRAYLATGQEDYVAALDELLQSWILANPVPLASNGGAGPAWETLSIAWRLREWLWIMGLAWSSPAFSRATKVLMLRSLWEQAASLMDHQGHPNNWRIVESAALALLGLCLPEFRLALEWRDAGLRRLEREYHQQFGADGVHREMSPLYHAICLHALLEVKEAAGVQGLELPDLFGKPLERGFDYLLALCRPDFTWPSLNDSGGLDSDFTALMSKAGESLQRPDLLWCGSRGRRGRPPEFSSRVFPDAGLAIMRSSYAARANYLLLRAGPPGLAHSHQDALSLEIAAGGAACLVDPGISRYAPGLLTDYYRSAAAHNMPLPDGAAPDYASLNFSQRVKPPGEKLSWSLAGPLEMAAGVFDGPWEPGLSGVALSRTVICARQEYWIVRDMISGQGRHQVRVGWQFAPGKLVMPEHQRFLDYLDRHNLLRLRLIPITVSAKPAIEILEGSLEPPGGWVSRGGQDYPAPQARYTWDAELPCSLVWVLLPISPD